MVDVVNNEVRRGGSYLAVHTDFFFSLVSDGVEDFGLFDCGPLVFFEGVVVGGVNESETAFSERDFSEGKAVTQEAVKQQEKNKGF
jgi:hypothetical protein